MSLFPDIKIDGHGRYDGLDPNGGSLQKVIQRNLFVEADRGQALARSSGPERELGGATAAQRGGCGAGRSARRERVLGPLWLPPPFFHAVTLRFTLKKS